MLMDPGSSGPAKCSAAASSRDEGDSDGPADWKVRTLFVSDLPLDVKPRELCLLFRPFKGYKGSLIKLISKQ
ncbi:RNA-binding protein with multiple splicing [Manis javanica]|nr:RNA-binding protein with multiple splicing [Manis javanica]